MAGFGGPEILSQSFEKQRHRLFVSSWGNADTDVVKMSIFSEFVVKLREARFFPVWSRLSQLTESGGGDEN